MNFLHVHSTYSIGDSPQQPEDIVKRAKELGGGTANVTLTDHRTLLGTDPFMEAGKKYGVNTIPGLEGDVLLPDYYASLLAGDDGKVLERLLETRNHILLIPFNYRGFQTISRASKAANGNMKWVNKTAYPCLTDEILEHFFKGNGDVFATSACIQGPVAYILLYNMRIQKKIKTLKDRMATCKEGYETYKKADADLRTVKAEIKRIRKEITAETKPLKKPFQEKVAKLRKKVENEMPGTDKWTKANTELEIALSLVQVATLKKGDLEKQVSKLEEEKKATSPCLAQNMHAYKLYVRCDGQVKELKKQLVPPDVLYGAAKRRLLELESIFSHFFIELQYHGMEEEAYAMPLLLKLADETDTSIIAANDAHITDPSERSIGARRLIRFNFFKKAETVTPQDRELYIKTEDELVKALSAVVPEDRAREAVGNLEILEKCRVEFPEGKHYPKVHGEKSFDVMVSEARQLKIEEGAWDGTHEEKFRHEINTIKTMGYEDYFMVVETICRIGRLMGLVPADRRNEIYSHFADLKEWVGREHFGSGIGVGPGRGSAVGSLVCFLLGITDIDPIRYGLLFERFLNPERVSMPDIDTDIATSIRPALISWLRWYFGEKAVCSIATVTTYGPKASIQLAGRDLADQKFDRKDVEGRSRFLHEKTYAVSDLVPSTPGISLSDCEKDIYPKICDDRDKATIWERAKLVENCVGATGVHAGGIVISDNRDINEYVPLAWNSEKKVWVAQSDMVRIEQKGLLKMDVLGLNMLDVENRCVALIKRHHGVYVDPGRIPFEQEVFQDIYASGRTNGVFQFESPGMKQMLKDFGPSCIDDIILLVAAYRPGPMQYLPDIIAVKNKRKTPSYKHPLLAPILSSTYGAVIYQEQVMQIFQTLAGYSLGGADLVRRAMSKKNTEKLALERKAFIYGDGSRHIDGCLKRGIPEETADRIFDEVMEFAKYAFNKSHAAAYAIVSYQTAWLKKHYTAEFLCSLFNCKPQDEFAPIFEDCRAYGITVLPPDVNSSFSDFVMENGCIRYGIMGIKGIGAANATLLGRICGERGNGYYKDIGDFLKRTATSENGEYSPIQDRALSIFIDAGMFDSMGYERESLKSAVTGEKSLPRCVGQDELFSRIDNMDFCPPGSNLNYNFDREIELLGSVLSCSPLKGYGTDAEYGCVRISELQDGEADIFGVVTEVKKMVTKNGDDMAKLRIQGKAGECSVLLMRGAYERYARDIQSYVGKVVKVQGRAKDGAVFCRSLSPIHPGVQNYVVVLDDIGAQERAVGIGGIHKLREKDDDVKLSMLIFFKADGTPLKKPCPILRWCSSATIRKLEALGITCSKA